MKTTPAIEQDNTADARWIPIDALLAHPCNSNVMAEPLLTKLMSHMARSGRYPPVIVRPLVGGGYQILDGHHRVEALKRLEHESARCVVWEVDDDESLLLLATLNRLQGRDDPVKRAALIARLRDRADLDALATLLPEQRADLDALLALRDQPPPPRAPRPLDQMPVAVHFFLLPTDRSRVERALRAAGGTREAALLKLVERAESVAPGHSEVTS